MTQIHNRKHHGINIRLQYIRYIDEYIPKLQIHQHYMTFHSQDMHGTQSGTRLLVTIVPRLTIRCRDGQHQDGRFTRKIDAYRWLNHDKDGTYNSNHINMPIG